MEVLVITSEWPTENRPNDVPFLVQYVDALRKQGIEVDVFHFTARANPLNYIKAWFEVRKHSSWVQADILHAQWGQSAFLALFSRKPLVITFHGSDLQGIVDSRGRYSFKGKILVAMNKLLSHTADRCIVVSRRLGELLDNSCRSVEVIPMGIDLHLFHRINQLVARKQLGLNQNTRYVLFISDPKRPEKRFALAQEAFASANIPNTELLVVSGQPYEKIPLYLNAGDLLLMTSSHEGSSVILKEALACNLPVVAVDVGDAREKLQDIAGCVVCEDDDPQTIARAITQALAYDKPINGRDSVLDLSWELIAQRTIAVYNQALHKSS